MKTWTYLTIQIAVLVIVPVVTVVGLWLTLKNPPGVGDKVGVAFLVGAFLLCESAIAFRHRFMARLRATQKIEKEDRTEQ